MKIYKIHPFSIPCTLVNISTIIPYEEQVTVEKEILAYLVAFLSTLHFKDVKLTVPKWTDHLIEATNKPKQTEQTKAQYLEDVKQQSNTWIARAIIPNGTRPQK
ncbi:Hypothetical predicted protein [Olea europaea subsp. europaea]|uniref:Uncharacterized protein n=1 Tax=Olea europaea subsp. europaea TaxID=158383 RepID=A0A8S0PQA2_OLEEU|nr:Hypothetical predicted protein [Olea europaea subsp. europaea]